MIFSFVQRCNNLLTYPSFVIHSFFWLQPLFLKLVTEFITRSWSWSCCISSLEMLLTHLSMKTAWLLNFGCLDSSITLPPSPKSPHENLGFWQTIIWLWFDQQIEPVVALGNKLGTNYFSREHAFANQISQCSSFSDESGRQKSKKTEDW